MELKWILTDFNSEIFWGFLEGSVPAHAKRVGPLDIIYKPHSFVKDSLYNVDKKPKCDKYSQQLEGDGGNLVPD